MPDVHLPGLDEPEDDDTAHEKNQGEPPHTQGPQTTTAPSTKSRRGGIGRILLEIALISAGVFLGLAGDQWRESAEHRAMGREALRRFRSEVAANRQAVADVEGYHADMRRRIESYLAADATARKSLTVAMKGVRPVTFEHTAWDLAIATQSLTYIDSSLAFDLSRIYSAQEDSAVLSRSMLQAMYLRPPAEDIDGFFRVVALYYDDVVLSEPKLIAMYDAMLPRLDKASAG
jgi:hypothetical protein